MPNEKQTYSFRLTTECKDTLNDLSKKNNLTLSAMIERCIKEFKPNNEKYYNDLENCIQLIMLSPTESNIKICISFLNVFFNNRLINENEYNNLRTLLIKD